MGEWYYIGHYGQLGPLTRDQINELIDAEVIAHDTYVWKVGMSEWIPASRTVELAAYFNARVFTSSPPPPPPSAGLGLVTTTTYADRMYSDAPVYSSYPRTVATVRSNKSRLLAGVLQLLIPGVGRMYLGYGAFGVLQLVFSMCFGLGVLWSFIDGIYILAGGIKYDGYMRRLGE